MAIKSKNFPSNDRLESIQEVYKYEFALNMNDGGTITLFFYAYNNYLSWYNLFSNGSMPVYNVYIGVSNKNVDTTYVGYFMAVFGLLTIYSYKLEAGNPIPEYPSIQYFDVISIVCNGTIYKNAKDKSIKFYGEKIVKDIPIVETL